MAFVYCKECHWKQDDFWNNCYNPVAYLNWIDDILSQGMRRKDKRKLSVDIDLIRDRHLRSKKNENGSYDVSLLDFVISEMENSIRLLRNMNWWTEDDFQNDTEPQCPVCGSLELEIKNVS